MEERAKFTAATAAVAATVAVAATAVAVTTSRREAAVPVQFRLFLEQERAELERQERDEWPRLLLQKHETDVEPVPEGDISETASEKEAYILQEEPEETVLSQRADSDEEQEQESETAEEENRIECEEGTEAGNEATAEGTNAEEEGEKESESKTAKKRETEEETEGETEGEDLIARQCDQQEDGITEAIAALVDRSQEVEERVWKALFLAMRAGEKYRAVRSYLCGMPAAVAQAQALDAAVAQSDAEGNSPGLLHGVLCSVSGLLQCEEATTAVADSPAVAAAKSAGALFLCKSAFPDLAAADATVGYLGRCQNPYNSGRQAGGSSAADAILLATGVVSLSIGVDVGGSAKLAAAFCGAAALHPTEGRVSDGGVGPACGRAVPLALSARDLAPALRALTSGAARAADPTLRLREFDEGQYGSSDSLRVGLLTDNGIISPSPSVAKGLETAAGALRARGHTVEAVAGRELTNIWRLYELSLARSRALAGAHRLPHQPPPHSSPLSSLAAWLSAAATHAFYLGRSSSLAALWNTPPATTAAELKAIEEELAGMQEGLEGAMAAAGLDLLLLPAYASLPPLAELPLDRYGAALPLANSYGACVDALDLPAGVLPVMVTVEEDNDVAREVRNPYEQLAFDNEQDGGNLPIAVQIVGGRDKDETVLRAMVEIEEEVSLAAPQLLREYRMKEFFGKPDAFACVSSSKFEEQITDDII